MGQVLLQMKMVILSAAVLKTGRLTETVKLFLKTGHTTKGILLIV